MRTFILSICIIFSFIASPAVWCRDKAEDMLFNNYTITGAERASAAGSYMVTVSVTHKDAKLSDADMARCAVHGVLFRGFAGKNTHFEKPLAGSASAEAQNKEYYDNFFATQAPSYAYLIPSSRSVTKVEKKKYLITQVVEVRKDALRKALQDAGVLKSLNSIF